MRDPHFHMLTKAIYLATALPENAVTKRRRARLMCCREATYKWWDSNWSLFDMCRHVEQANQRSASKGGSPLCGSGLIAITASG